MNRNGTPANLRPFKPGQSGNPGGKPAAARNALQGGFMNALCDDWELHGKQAIIRCREESPTRYVEIIASIVNKIPERPSSGPWDDITDDELRQYIELIRQSLAAA
jgi:hypothetical protein